jgi:hypothetical protein
MALLLLLLLHGKVAKAFQASIAHLFYAGCHGSTQQALRRVEVH